MERHHADPAAERANSDPIAVDDRTPGHGRHPRRQAPSSLRRNLFANHLPSRRPVSTIPPTAPPTTVAALGTQDVERSDIVVKDEKGNYDLRMPILPSKMDSEGEIYDEPSKRAAEDRKLELALRKQLTEQAQPHPGKRSRQRKRTPTPLAEPVVPPELVNAVKQSLRRRVAALADDDWMFE